MFKELKNKYDVKPLKRERSIRRAFYVVAKGETVSTYYVSQ